MNTLRHSFSSFLSLLVAFIVLSPLTAFGAVTVYNQIPYAYVYSEAAAQGIQNPYKSSIHGTGAVAPATQRSCFLVDPTAYPSNWTVGQYHSPSDNSVLKWESVKGGAPAWSQVGAKNNLHLKSLICSTDATADAALSASKTQIAKGGSAQLTWLSQYGKTRKATCTATNFDTSIFVPAHQEATPIENPVCSGGSPFDGSFQQNAAGSFCGPFIGMVWVPSYTGPAPFGGTQTVSPTETTTYTYSCTNANGVETSSVTIEVLNQPDPSCSDGQDNDTDGNADAADTDCQGGGSYTEIAPSNQADLTASAVKQTTLPQGSPTILSATIKNIGGLAVTVGFSNLFQIDNDEDHSSVFATRVAEPSTGSTGGGTWVFSAFDQTDLQCPITDPGKVHQNLPDCSQTNPIGTSCSPSTDTRCKTNVIAACTVESNLYKCQANTGTPVTPPLPPGGTTDTQVTYTFPSGGTWYVRTCADNNASFHGTVAESNENNNCSAGGWKAVTVSNDSPGARLSASPSEVFSGDEATLTWACDKSTGASIDHGIGAVTPVAGGSVSTGPLLAQTDYTLTCTGADGVGHAYTSVRVKHPEVDIKAAPPLVKRGGATTITWSSVGANVCAVSGSGLSSALKNGSKTVTVENQTTYTITCNGVSTDSVTVGLIPEFNEQ